MYKSIFSLIAAGLGGVVGYCEVSVLGLPGFLLAIPSGILLGLGCSDAGSRLFD